VITAPAAELAPLRAALRRLAKPGQRRVHFNDEGDRRRREILARITQLGLRAHVWRHRHADDVVARQTCLTELVPVVLALDVRRLVLESCQHQDARDRRTLAAAVREHGGGLEYEHRRPSEDPLLWVSDAVAWCYGAGGEWRRRAEPLLDSVICLN
jgi:hypothetical protein